MTNILKLHRALVTALQELEQITAENETLLNEYARAKQAYDDKFESDNADLVQRYSAAMDRQAHARKTFEGLRKEAGIALNTEDRLNDLPPGLKQTKEKVLVVQEYQNRENLRDAVMKEMPALLVVDRPALEKLAFTVAVDNGNGGFNLPGWLERLPISVEMHYRASISDATLRTLPRPTAAELEDTEDFTRDVDPLVVPKRNGDTTIAHIIEWKRTQWSDTGATWECITREGYQFNILIHRVERLTNFPLFEDAGYSNALNMLEVGQSQHWTEHPIQVEIQKSGELWRVVKVTERPDGAMPDGYAKPQPEKPATTRALIIGLERGETINSLSPKWKCTTLKPVSKGLRIFKHEDPDKDSFHFFQEAGYGEFLMQMGIGEKQDWVQFPIEVEIAEKDGWWNIVGVMPRTEGAAPDLPQVTLAQDDTEDGAALESLRGNRLDLDDDTELALPPGITRDDIPF